MSHIKISSLGIKAAGDNSLNKNNLHTIPDPVIKTECYPGDWEMLYKRICESRSCRNSWSIAWWHGIILKNTDSHTESGAALSLPASCDSLTVERNNCQWPQPYQITAHQMEKAKLRRLICSGLRYVLLSISGRAEGCRGSLPK